MLRTDFGWLSPYCQQSARSLGQATGTFVSTERPEAQVLSYSLSIDAMIDSR